MSTFFKKNRHFYLVADINQLTALKESIEFSVRLGSIVNKEVIILTETKKMIEQHSVIRKCMETFEIPFKGAEFVNRYSNVKLSLKAVRSLNGLFPDAIYIGYFAGSNLLKSMSNIGGNSITVLLTLPVQEAFAHLERPELNWIKNNSAKKIESDIYSIISKGCEVAP